MFLYDCIVKDFKYEENYESIFNNGIEPERSLKGILYKKLVCAGFSQVFKEGLDMLLNSITFPIESIKISNRTDNYNYLDKCIESYVFNRDTYRDTYSDETNISKSIINDKIKKKRLIRTKNK